jgi:hypothetical protein
MTQMKASVEMVQASVKTLVIGDRQVTVGVFKQVDKVPYEQLEVWGRVALHDSWLGDDQHVWLVGRDVETGRLARCQVVDPDVFGGGVATAADREQWAEVQALDPLVLSGR